MNQSRGRRGAVGWTSDCGYRGFEPHTRPPLFPWARNFNLIAQYWLVPGMASSV